MPCVDHPAAHQLVAIDPLLVHASGARLPRTSVSAAHEIREDANVVAGRVLDEVAVSAQDGILGPSQENHSTPVGLPSYAGPEMEVKCINAGRSLVDQNEPSLVVSGPPVQPISEVNQLSLGKQPL